MDNLRKEIEYMMSQVDGSGIIGDEALQFVRDAIEAKLAGQDYNVAVARKNYIDSLNDVKNRLDNHQFGQFVRNTVWTSMENGREDHK